MPTEISVKLMKMKISSFLKKMLKKSLFLLQRIGMVCQSSVPRGFSVERYVPAFIEQCEFVGLGESRITEQSPFKQKGNYRNGKIIEKKLQVFS